LHQASRETYGISIDNSASRRIAEPPYLYFINYRKGGVTMDIDNTFVVLPKGRLIPNTELSILFYVRSILVEWDSVGFLTGASNKTPLILAKLRNIGRFR
jgi:hypothetical protein